MQGIIFYKYEFHDIFISPDKIKEEKTSLLKSFPRFLWKRFWGKGTGEKDVDI